LFGGSDTDLSRFFDTSKHLRPTSDITALMVFEHQVKMHNYITRLSFDAQIMTKMYGHIRYLRSQVDAFLRYVLFTEEALLTAPIVADADYAKRFTALGPFDAKGRSLREFDRSWGSWLGSGFDEIYPLGPSITDDWRLPSPETMLLSRRPISCAKALIS